MSILNELSVNLAAIVTSSGQSVVRVEGRPRLAASGTVWSADGLIITANHVVPEDEDLHVGLSDGNRLKATLVGRDPSTDLAVLRVEAKLVTASTWVDPEDLRVGHLVLALGRPGRTVRATLGIISALGESWRTIAGGNIDRYLQIDATLYPGFSGGPLVTAEGNVIGMNTSGLMRGIAIAVPTPTVRQVVEELLTRGRISRGYLGVGTQPARLPSDLARQLDQETGLLVISVEPGSPSDKAGMVLGDAIVSIGTKSFQHWEDLLSALGKDQIGTTVEIQIVRAGKLHKLAVNIGEHP
jgi:S1-C subfamily serine protease